METLHAEGRRNQWDLHWMVGPDANHAAVLGFKPLLDVQEMTNGLGLEPSIQSSFQWVNR